MKLELNMLTKSDVAEYTDVEESLCRLISTLRGVDPDHICWGLGAGVEQGLEYSAWKYHLPLIRALQQEGWLAER